MDALIASGNLLARGQVKHSYPHSWRSKAPLIFRATPQWFIAMDKAYDVGGGKTLRDVALGEIERVDWVTEQAKNRIHGMIKDRPDWLISRQRAWGVPLAMFVRKSDGQILIDDEVDARIVSAMRAGGADVWWETPAQVFLGDKYKAEEFEKIEDILDVWFDSGSTHAFVLETRPTLKRPASLYLEGSDQHRGWFHSSLLECCATRGQAPYDAVLTHGFAVDEQGRKMSKSVGNTVEPQKIAKENGIEILRILIASAEYGDDLRMGKVILDQASETYRKLRNTLRYLLGALKGFDETVELRPSPLVGEGGASESERRVRGESTDTPHPSATQTPSSTGGEGQLPLLEKWLLHRLWELDRDVRAGFETYQFRAALTAIVEFCNVDLSAFYVDVRKDTLYCDAPSSPRRRACLAALSAVFERLTAWLAPIMPFTMEEAWATRFADAASLHLKQFPQTPESWRDDVAASTMAKLRRARSVVTGALEEKRRAKEIGSALEAAPRVFVNDADLRALLEKTDFAELCITSAAHIEAGDGPADAFRLPEAPGIAVQFAPAPGVKCARSWKYFDPETADPRFPDITPRDAQAVMEWDASHA
jgi:isoleucyl-tRNA synthetase